MSTGLISALVAAAKGARTDHSISKERVADELGKSTDTIRRFEKGGVYPALDELMDAYSKATGVSLMDLLDDAKEHLKKNGSAS